MDTQGGGRAGAVSGLRGWAHHIPGGSSISVNADPAKLSADWSVSNQHIEAPSDAEGLEQTFHAALRGRMKRSRRSGSGEARGELIRRGKLGHIIGGSDGTTQRRQPTVKIDDGQGAKGGGRDLRCCCCAPGVHVPADQVCEIPEIPPDGQKHSGQPGGATAVGDAAVPPPRGHFLGSVAPPVAAAAAGPRLGEDAPAEPVQDGMSVRELRQPGVSAREDRSVEALDVCVGHCGEGALRRQERGAEEVEQEAEERGAGGARPACAGAGRRGGRLIR